MSQEVIKWSIRSNMGAEAPFKGHEIDKNTALAIFSGLIECENPFKVYTGQYITATGPYIVCRLGNRSNEGIQ